ncbi:DUF2946 family protein [Neoaquamicrobium sediminum]|uniref:DUF2946 family protein n=1 Tax=Neoaquamicrobium sediminum TaxID=1849104 RepID=UPI003BAC55B6
MNTARRPTWFATLRRDRGLFALIGCLILLLNVLQPVTAVKADENGLWVICTVYGAEKPLDGSDLPASLQEKCPICLFGHSGHNAPIYRALPAAEPAFPTPLALSFVQTFVEADENFVPRPDDPPPAIRGPPLSA